MTVPLSFRRQHSLPHPLIVVLDSLNWQRTGEVARIRAFLAAEWEVKEREWEGRRGRGEGVLVNERRWKGREGGEAERMCH